MMTLLFCKATYGQGASRKSQRHTQKNSRKCREVILALANKVKLCIKPTQSKAGRPKTEYTESGKEWLKNNLDKLDIIYVTPDRKNHGYVGKVDGKRQYVQKRYLI